MKTELTVSSGERPKRLDQYFVLHQRDISRARAQRLIALGRIRVNGLQTKASRLVRAGDQIMLEGPPPAQWEQEGVGRLVDVLFEDDCLLVLNKPAGVAMHPGPGHWSDTLVNAVLHYFVGSGSSGLRPGLVHRLDSQTSGVVVIAKTTAAHRSLSLQFERHTVQRRYVAFVSGSPLQDRGQVDLSIGRDRHNSGAVSGDTAMPKTARTCYEVTERYGEVAACLSVRPHTGRTHQIRAHLTSIGHPILGDVLYGGATRVGPDRPPLARVMLHADSLGYRHPASGRYHEHRAEFPEELLALQTSLQKSEGLGKTREDGPTTR